MIRGTAVRPDNGEADLTGLPGSNLQPGRTFTRPDGATVEITSDMRIQCDECLTYVYTRRVNGGTPVMPDDCPVCGMPLFEDTDG